VCVCVCVRVRVCVCERERERERGWFVHLLPTAAPSFASLPPSSPPPPLLRGGMARSVPEVGGDEGGPPAEPRGRSSAVEERR
jgi:hypothetical protein